MKTNIYFVRHAESDFTVKDEVIRPLTEKGLIDSKQVTIALMNKNITVVYSSPYKRTMDTVRDFADHNEIDIIPVEGFSERKVGKWVEDFKAFSRSQWGDFEFKLENGESLREVQQRNIDSLFSVLEINKGKNVVIGTHGTALSTILNYFDANFGYEHFWEIVDRMPYILCFTFNDSELESITEIEVQ